jgi:hypothetical protein
LDSRVIGPVGIVFSTAPQTATTHGCEHSFYRCEDRYGFKREARADRASVRVGSWLALLLREPKTAKKQNMVEMS